MDPSILTIVFGCGIIIGVLAVVMGGTLFLSFPLFQILFPEMSLAAIVGNIKIGSVLRNVTALMPLYKNLDARVLLLAPILCIGSLVGSYFTAMVSLSIIPLVLVLGLMVHEFGRKIAIHKSVYWVALFLVGFYGGVFGAGILLLVLALVTMQYRNLVDARTNALLLELLVSAIAVFFFAQLALINWSVALVWALGGMIGGYLGGLVIRYSGRWPETTQNWLVRTSFLVAFIVALVKLS